ncbi:DegV family protein [Abyssisolibacter fermentans]|uniref:DegV family protein n=1 Tax=Abyssisolibacter fermentans TaxID=1766203 RepID=UPI000832C3E4|nr:DegV family protein [Abyssisolibacter fermentans]
MFKIISDSSCDLNDKLKKLLNINIVPLNIQVGNKNFLGVESLSPQKIIGEMKKCLTSPKTSSPSPEKFINAFKGIEKVFVVTLSSKLSSTYNNAMLAKEIFLEDMGKKFIHVFDSKSASVGQTLVSMKIAEYIQQNLSEKIIVEKVNSYIDEMKTFFVLESLDNLVKAGRISKLKGKLASTLSIKPIMKGNDLGEIELVKKVRGTKKALEKLIDIIESEGLNIEDKILGITHCNCLDRALKFKEDVVKRLNFKDVIIVEAAPISTVYANEGGIVIAF